MGYWGQSTGFVVGRHHTETQVAAAFGLAEWLFDEKGLALLVAL
tara:strand:- start:13 stop:144 length:132 start_codon:yes stop_codon:yes gene_type:complete